jgi:hypothetical protein
MNFSAEIIYSERLILSVVICDYCLEMLWFLIGRSEVAGQGPNGRLGVWNLSFIALGNIKTLIQYVRQ